MAVRQVNETDSLDKLRVEFNALAAMTLVILQLFHQLFLQQPLLVCKRN